MSQTTCHRWGNSTGFWALLVISICLICVPIQTSSQTVGGVMLGTVTDQTGAVIAGVSVFIKNLGTGVVTNAKTNSAGFYTAPTLPPGNYEVTATSSGFRTEVHSGITLTVGASEVVNLQMRVGNATDKIVVSSTAASVELAAFLFGSLRA